MGLRERKTKRAIKDAFLLLRAKRPLESRSRAAIKHIWKTERY